jgi:hypothetical protein
MTEWVDTAILGGHGVHGRNRRFPSPASKAGLVGSNVGTSAHPPLRQSDRAIRGRSSLGMGYDGRIRTPLARPLRALPVARGR